MREQKRNRGIVLTGGLRMSSKTSVLLVLMLCLGGVSVAAASPPIECSPEPADPDGDPKNCPSGEWRPRPLPPPPPPAQPEGLAMVQHLSARLLERMSPGRGREGR
jgi:hypothetical protein